MRFLLYRVSSSNTKLATCQYIHTYVHTNLYNHVLPCILYLYLLVGLFYTARKAWIASREKVVEEWKAKKTLEALNSNSGQKEIPFVEQK